MPQEKASILYAKNETPRGPVSVSWGACSEKVQDSQRTWICDQYCGFWIIFYRNQPWRRKQYFQSSQRKKRQKNPQMVKNFECLTIPQGSSKPDLPSLESVVMAQRTQWVLCFASLSTTGNLRGKRTFVSESSSTPAAYSPCLMS